MRTLLERFQPAAGFVSGVLIGLAVITPVFAAASTSTESWDAFLIIGATMLLAVAFMLKATAGRSRPTRVRIAAGDARVRDRR